MSYTASQVIDRMARCVAHALDDIETTIGAPMPPHLRRAVGGDLEQLLCRWMENVIELRGGKK